MQHIILHKGNQQLKSNDNCGLWTRLQYIIKQADIKYGDFHFYVSCQSRNTSGFVIPPLVQLYPYSPPKLSPIFSPFTEAPLTANAVIASEIYAVDKIIAVDNRVLVVNRFGSREQPTRVVKFWCNKLLLHLHTLQTVIFSGVHVVFCVHPSVVLSKSKMS